MLAFVIQNHSHRAGADLGRELVGRLACHGSTFSGVGASDQPGAVQCDFVDAYNFARRLKTLRGLTPYEFVCKAWTSQPQRFTISPLQKMPGLNTWSVSIR